MTDEERPLPDGGQVAGDPRANPISVGPSEQTRYSSQMNSNDPDASLPVVSDL